MRSAKNGYSARQAASRVTDGSATGAADLDGQQAKPTQGSAGEVAETIRRDVQCFKFPLMYAVLRMQG